MYKQFELCLTCREKSNLISRTNEIESIYNMLQRYSRIYKVSPTRTINREFSSLLPSINLRCGMSICCKVDTHRIKEVELKTLQLIEPIIDVIKNESDKKKLQFIHSFRSFYYSRLLNYMNTRIK